MERNSLPQTKSYKLDVIKVLREFPARRLSGHSNPKKVKNEWKTGAA
jgi:hypothetical protein